MKDNKLEAYERETIINWSDADKKAEVQCYQGRIQKRLEQLAAEHPDECYKIKEHMDGAAEYVIPKSWVKINPPQHREYTDEQRAAMAARAARLKKNTETQNQGE